MHTQTEARPLFAATLLAFLVAIVWTNNGIDVERDALILFDLLLVIVLGLLLYGISARDLAARPGLFDRLQLALVVSALIIDVMVLLFATLAGVLIAAGGSGPVAPTTGLEWTGLAFGAVLLGGTSAFGRRGGILGTLLAVVGLTLFLRYDDERGLDIAPTAVAAAILAAGLVVTRLVESYGRPRSAVRHDEVEWEEDEPEPSPPPAWDRTDADGADTWSGLPGQDSPGRPDPWTTDRWTER